MADFISKRPGDTWRFRLDFNPVLPTRYTKARLVLRESWDESSDLLLDVDETTGLTIAPDGSSIDVEISAVLTAAIPPTCSRRPAVLLRWSNPADDTDADSAPVPFVLLPDVIP
jgi:hypothetical protein